MKHPFLPLLLATACFAGSLTTVAPAAEPAKSIQLPMTDDGLAGTGPIRRAEWFQRLWTERRTAWVADAAKDQGALVFVGDSITQGWWEVGSFFPGTQIANRGISGDTTRGVLIRLKEDVLSLNPRGIVMLIGTNDLEDNATPEVIAGNLRLILTAYRDYNPKMPVVLLSVLPSSSTMRRPADAIRKINSLYRAVAGDFPQVTLLDTWSVFANVNGDAKLEDMPDLLHPNSFGYAKMATALRPILETLELVPSWPDDFKPEPGFVSLFNGHDLTGWVAASGETLDGKVSSPESRYIAKNGRLVVTASRQGQIYTQLWTAKKFPKDFVLRLEFRASPGADSGVYIREPQLQCRDYPVAGPFSHLKNFHTTDWNLLEVTVRGGLAHATCNGEVIMDAMEVPATGPIGLESDRGQMEYRRLRIQTTE